MRVLVALLSFFCATSPCVADTFPQWDVYWMCADADAVVVGEQLDGDKVTVTKWIKGAANDTPGPIIIADISKHSKSINAFWTRLAKKPSTTLTTLHFVAFLEHKNGTWRSMATIDESGLCGSCGMIWIQDGHCYRYAQAMNPGPYDLYEAKDVKSEADLFQFACKLRRNMQLSLHVKDC